MVIQLMDLIIKFNYIVYCAIKIIILITLYKWATIIVKNYLPKTNTKTVFVIVPKWFVA